MSIAANGSATNRRSLVRDIANRLASHQPAAGASPLPPRTSEYFGCNTFGARQMRDKLPKDVAKKLVASIRQGKKLDIEIAPVVAQVIKEWALARGVTHFTHW